MANELTESESRPVSLTVEARYQPYLSQLHERLKLGRKTYGDMSLELPALRTLQELQLEMLDIAGWGYVLHEQVERMCHWPSLRADRRGNPAELKALRELEELMAEGEAPGTVAVVEALKRITQARLDDNAPSEPLTNIEMGADREVPAVRMSGLLLDHKTSPSLFEVTPGVKGPIELKYADEQLLVHQVLEELHRATKTFGNFNSGHEGHSIIREELDELWDEVKTSKVGRDYGVSARRECIQIAAMAMRFVLDLCK